MATRLDDLREALAFLDEDLRDSVLEGITELNDTTAKTIIERLGNIPDLRLPPDLKAFAVGIVQQHLQEERVAETAAQAQLDERTNKLREQVDALEIDPELKSAAQGVLDALEAQGSDDILEELTIDELLDRASKVLKASKSGGLIYDEDTGQVVEVDDGGTTSPVNPYEFVERAYLDPQGRGMPDYLEAAIADPRRVPGQGRPVFDPDGIHPFVDDPTEGAGGLVPRYKQGDEWNRFFRNLPPERIAEIQQDMLQAGVLTDDYRKGVWDVATAEAMARVMGWANMNRSTSWWQALEDLLANPVTDNDGRGGLGGLQPFTYAPYRPPDWATLETQVVNVFRTVLGRKPRGRELIDFANHLLASHQEAYDRDLEVARQQYLRTKEAIATDGEAAGGEGPPEVDPIARLIRELETTRRDEIELAERQEARQLNTRTLFSSLAGLDRMVE